MIKTFHKNTKYEVLTPDGFKPFAGVSLMNISPVWRVETATGLFLECTYDHKLFINGEQRTPLSDIRIGDELFTMSGYDKIIKIENTGRTEPVYDLIEVEDGHRFYANKILSSNCKFVTFEETLINAGKLAQLESMPPLYKTGQVRWFAPVSKDCTYVVSLDPSMGTGGDNAAIQVFELPTLKQVAEWQHNRTPVEGQIRILRQICKDIHANGAPEIYWSVENNSLGEAALVVIRDTGEENIPGTMLHDPANRAGGKRKGFTTTNRTKMEACSRLKSMVESGKMKIFSKGLISELKVFVALGNTFQARTGMTDDLVSAALLFCRMAEYIASWDDTSWNVMNTSVADGEHHDDYEQPMPLSVF